MSSPDRCLEYIAPEQLAQVWERVRAGLDKIPRSDGWIPEDVYHALKLNHATLHLVIVDNCYCGFVVLQPKAEFKKRLHIWLLYNESKHDVMEIFKPTLEDFARNINAVSLTFSSPRQGWARVAGRYGFTPMNTTYEASL